MAIEFIANKVNFDHYECINILLHEVCCTFIWNRSNWL